ncbi:Hypothetical_protein [Hexamita inflata]|uniref:Hypothetical_protein n=1 Tax=Hexamita inflata TaxID=28002 RepID=A0AA86V022_9EUKA|nr:Hypothetical protein HINF_LOCUS58741 [Hexamita inflata]
MNRTLFLSQRKTDFDLLYEVQLSPVKLNIKQIIIILTSSELSQLCADIIQSKKLSVCYLLVLAENPSMTSTQLRLLLQLLQKSDIFSNQQQFSELIFKFQAVAFDILLLLIDSGALKLVYQIFITLMDNILDPVQTRVFILDHLNVLLHITESDLQVIFNYLNTDIHYLLELLLNDYKRINLQFTNKMIQMILGLMEPNQFIDVYVMELNEIQKKWDEAVEFD